MSAATFTLAWSEFASHTADSVWRRNASWSELIERIKTATGYASKKACPWVKLAVFGDARTAKKSLRHDANLLQISGVEGDYDGEVMTPDEAMSKLDRAQIKCIVYTSPSHTPAKPRWRVLAPCSMEMSPTARNALLARVNGVLGGVLSGESFTLSQSYYFGAVVGAEYRVLTAFGDPDEGHFIDELDELDQGAIGKPSEPKAHGAESGERARPGEETFAAAEQRVGRKLRGGDGRRELLKSYIGSCSSRGLSAADIKLLIAGIAARYFDPADPIDEANIDEIVRWAGARDQQAGAARAARLADPKWRADQLDRARALLAPTMPQRKAPDYPVSALGPLAEACRVISEHAQVQPGMTGQCLLGAASLLTQGLFNVETLAGTRPLSLNLLTLGDSGDGKSQAQNVALGAVYEWQRAKSKAHAAEVDAIRSAPRKRGEPPPEMPTAPYRVCRDGTVEGVRRDLDHGVVSQGLFSDEAAAIISGYGMTPENRAKSAAVFSGLWDNGHLSVSRAGSGRVERYGKRLAMHWLIQPSAAAGATADGLLVDLGFWPRFLLAWPDELAPRRDLPFKAAEHEAIRALWSRCRELLAVALPEDATDCPVLPLADDARELMGKALEAFERDGRRGALRAVKPFALRATEQACRVAGVQAAFEGRRVVSLEDAKNALALVAYSLQTWRAVIDDGQADATSPNALRLYEWLLDPKKCANGTAKLSRIVNAGPACVRSKDKRNDAVDALVATKLVVLTDDGSVMVRLDGAA